MTAPPGSLAAVCAICRGMIDPRSQPYLANGKGYTAHKVCYEANPHKGMRGGWSKVAGGFTLPISTTLTVWALKLPRGWFATASDARGMEITKDGPFRTEAEAKARAEAFPRFLAKGTGPGGAAETRTIVCAVCGEESGAKGSSMYGSVHKYGPVTHEFRPKIVGGAAENPSLDPAYEAEIRKAISKATFIPKEAGPAECLHCGLRADRVTPGYTRDETEPRLGREECARCGRHDYRFLGGPEANPRAVEACEFVRRQPHEWFCETHKSLKIAGTSAPVFCDVAAHQRGISEANPAGIVWGPDPLDPSGVSRRAVIGDVWLDAYVGKMGTYPGAAPFYSWALNDHKVRGTHVAWGHATSVEDAKRKAEAAYRKYQRGEIPRRVHREPMESEANPKRRKFPAIRPSAERAMIPLGETVAYGEISIRPDDFEAVHDIGPVQVFAPNFPTGLCARLVGEYTLQVYDCDEDPDSIPEDERSHVELPEANIAPMIVAAALPIVTKAIEQRIAPKKGDKNPALPYATGTIPRGIEKVHPYDKIFKRMKEQYGGKRGKSVFYAWLRGVSPLQGVPAAEPARGRRDEANPLNEVEFGKHQDKIAKRLQAAHVGLRDTQRELDKIHDDTLALPVKFPEANPYKAKEIWGLIMGSAEAALRDPANSEEWVGSVRAYLNTLTETEESRFSKEFPETFEWGIGTAYLTGPAKIVGDTPAAMKAEVEKHKQMVESGQLPYAPWREGDEPVEANPRGKQIVVTIKGGAVQDVSGVPKGWLWDLLDWDNLAAGDPHPGPVKPKVTRIEVRGGVLQSVTNLPPGYSYRLVDLDEAAANPVHPRHYTRPMRPGFPIDGRRIDANPARVGLPQIYRRPELPAGRDPVADVLAAMEAVPVRKRMKAGVPYDEVLERLKKMGYTGLQADEAMNSAMDRAFIHEPVIGILRRISEANPRRPVIPATTTDQDKLAREWVKKSGEIPDYFAPKEPALGGDWAFIPSGDFSLNRDSTLLPQSNFFTISKDLLARFPKDVQIVRSSHWAVGWVDQIAVRMISYQGGATPAAEAVFEWIEKLQSYPVADDEDYSSRQTDATAKNIVFESRGTLDDATAWEVQRWLWNNNERAVEDVDDRGGYPSREQINEALVGLGKPALDAEANPHLFGGRPGWQAAPEERAYHRRRMERIRARCRYAAHDRLLTSGVECPECGKQPVRIGQYSSPGPSEANPRLSPAEVEALRAMYGERRPRLTENPYMERAIGTWKVTPAAERAVRAFETVYGSFRTGAPLLWHRAKELSHHRPITVAAMRQALQEAGYTERAGFRFGGAEENPVLSPEQIESLQAMYGSRRPRLTEANPWYFVEAQPPGRPRTHFGKVFTTEAEIQRFLPGSTILKDVGDAYRPHTVVVRSRPPRPPAEANPRRRTLYDRWVSHEVRVEEWAERDRLHIGIQDEATGEYLASWWDDEAHELFEDGYFKRGPGFEESVVRYADSIGVGARPSRRHVPAANPLKREQIVMQIGSVVVGGYFSPEQNRAEAYGLYRALTGNEQKKFRRAYPALYDYIVTLDQQPAAGQREAAVADARRMGLSEANPLTPAEFEGIRPKIFALQEAATAGARRVRGAAADLYNRALTLVRNEANPEARFPSRAAFERSEKRAIERSGRTAVKARYDSAGNCVYCGEAGRCPGWHTQPVGAEANPVRLTKRELSFGDDPAKVRRYLSFDTVALTGIPAPDQWAFGALLAGHEKPWYLGHLGMAQGFSQTTLPGPIADAAAKILKKHGVRHMVTAGPIPVERLAPPRTMTEKAAQREIREWAAGSEYPFPEQGESEYVYAQELARKVVRGERFGPKEGTPEFDEQVDLAAEDYFDKMREAQDEEFRKFAESQGMTDEDIQEIYEGTKEIPWLEENPGHSLEAARRAMVASRLAARTARGILPRRLPLPQIVEAEFHEVEENPRYSKEDRAGAEVMLRKFLKPGDTVHTLLRHVSKSGMARDISLYTFQNNQPVYLDGYVAKYLGLPLSKDLGVRVGGVGMDMGFALVHELSQGLFKDGRALKHGGWMEAEENPRQPADVIAARELKLFIDQHIRGRPFEPFQPGTLWSQQFLPIVKNLLRKMKKGVYDREKAVVLWGYLVDNGAKMYAGAPGPWMPQTVPHSFTKATRMEVARMLCDEFEARVAAGEFAALDLRIGHEEFEANPILALPGSVANPSSAGGSLLALPRAEENPDDARLRQYLATALWSSSDEDETPLDQRYGMASFAPEAIARARDDLDRFFKSANGERLLEDVDDDGQVAHDFWLTRNHHGAGFWDRAEIYGEHGAKRLTEIAGYFDAIDVVVGDDGKLYFEGGKRPAANPYKPGTVFGRPMKPETIARRRREAYAEQIQRYESLIRDMRARDAEGPVLFGEEAIAETEARLAELRAQGPPSEANPAGFGRWMGGCDRCGHNKDMHVPACAEVLSATGHGCPCRSFVPEMWYGKPFEQPSRIDWTKIKVEVNPRRRETGWVIASPFGEIVWGGDGEGITREYAARILRENRRALQSQLRMGGAKVMHIEDVPRGPRTEENPRAVMAEDEKRVYVARLTDYAWKRGVQIEWPMAEFYGYAVVNYGGYQIPLSASEAGNEKAMESFIRQMPQVVAVAEDLARGRGEYKEIFYSDIHLRAAFGDSAGRFIAYSAIAEILRSKGFALVGDAEANPQGVEICPTCGSEGTIGPAKAEKSPQGVEGWYVRRCAACGAKYSEGWSEFEYGLPEANKLDQHEVAELHKSMDSYSGRVMSAIDRAASRLRRSVEDAFGRVREDLPVEKNPTVYSMQTERMIRRILGGGDMTLTDMGEFVPDHERAAFRRVLDRMVGEGKIYVRPVGSGLPAYYSLAPPAPFVSAIPAEANPESASWIEGSMVTALKDPWGHGEDFSHGYAAGLYFDALNEEERGAFAKRRPGVARRIEGGGRPEANPRAYTRPRDRSFRELVCGCYYEYGLGVVQIKTGCRKHDPGWREKTLGAEANPIGLIGGALLGGIASGLGFATVNYAVQSARGNAEENPTRRRKSAPTVDTSGWDLVKLRAAVEGNRAKWAAIARKYGWYKEPFHLQVWLRRDGTVADSVSHTGFTEPGATDLFKDELSDRLIPDPIAGIPAPRVTAAPRAPVIPRKKARVGILIMFKLGLPFSFEDAAHKAGFRTEWPDDENLREMSIVGSADDVIRAYEWAKGLGYPLSSVQLWYRGAPGPDHEKASRYFHGTFDKKAKRWTGGAADDLGKGCATCDRLEAAYDAAGRISGHDPRRAAAVSAAYHPYQQHYLTHGRGGEVEENPRWTKAQEQKVQDHFWSIVSGVQVSERTAARDMITDIEQISAEIGVPPATIRSILKARVGVETNPVREGPLPFAATPTMPPGRSATADALAAMDAVPARKRMKAGVPFEDTVQRLKQMGYTEDQAVEALNLALDQGLISEPVIGILRRLSEANPAVGTEMRSLLHRAGAFRKPVPVEGVPSVFDGFADWGEPGWFIGRINVDARDPRAPRIYKTTETWFPDKEGAIAAFKLEYPGSDPNPAYRFRGETLWETPEHPGKLFDRHSWDFRSEAPYTHDGRSVYATEWARGLFRESTPLYRPRKIATTRSLHPTRRPSWAVWSEENPGRCDHRDGFSEVKTSPGEYELRCVSCGSPWPGAEANPAARVRVLPHTSWRYGPHGYEDVPGHLITGRDTRGRGVRIHARTKEGAEEIREAIKIGDGRSEDPIISRVLREGRESEANPGADTAVAWVALPEDAKRYLLGPLTGLVKPWEFTDPEAEYRRLMEAPLAELPIPAGAEEHFAHLVEWLAGIYTPRRRRRRSDANPEGANGYVAFYGGKQIEVYADTSYQAQQKAVAIFRPPRSRQHMVTVVLAEKGGVPVTHLPLLEANPSPPEAEVKKAVASYETFHQDQPTKMKKVKFPIKSKALMEIGAWTEARYFSPKWGRQDQKRGSRKGHYYYHPFKETTKTGREGVMAYDPVSKYLVAWAPIKVLPEGVDDLT